MQPKKRQFSLLIVLFLLAYSCQTDDDNYTPLIAEEGEAYSGGETTVFNTSPEAFGFKAANLDQSLDADFGIGNSLFRQNWVTAPASTTARDGLGPFFNARACSGCHFKDGRGRAPLFNGDTNHGMLLRLSIPGTTANGSNLPEPIYGGQLQDNAILNTSAEANFEITYTNIVVEYPDGNTVTLQKPTYSFANLAYGEMASNVQISPRVGNQMIGLGLLEAIPESTLIGFSDEFDSDNDGISGKPNYAWNVQTQSLTIGRFGWKANTPTIKQQVAGAFSGDLGITSSLFPDENCPTGVDCNDFITGGTPEIIDLNLNRVTTYSSVLNVPGRRDYDEQNVLEGKELFNSANCTACHKPKIVTGNHTIEALENQTIRPYTDLLLHDMGEGLADNRPDFNANGQEWRTQPLWGIGLIETVNNHTNLLHDGRARNIEEAILWHDGEAAEAKNNFMNLSATKRQLVLDFINSL
ncbi:di-heme oxidoredictase family protein [Winogradskyella sp.]|uniref:di-heme oxidoreductase family protein n=1 Tax=Winogradskyella sp. TaxID=1883156 RepID=UPI0025DD77A2|nr:di-heme oxidoredictase family protein [Winogradskyella sp.]